jgi:hypothetical protein
MPGIDWTWKGGGIIETFDAKALVYKYKES